MSKFQDSLDGIPWERPEKVLIHVLRGLEPRCAKCVHFDRPCIPEYHVGPDNFPTCPRFDPE